jgi:hypothetical protein
VFIGVVFASEIRFDVAYICIARERAGDEPHIVFVGEAVRAFGGEGLHLLAAAERDIDGVDDVAVRADVLDEADGGGTFAENTEASCLKRRATIDAGLLRCDRRGRRCRQSGNQSGSLSDLDGHLRIGRP